MPKAVSPITREEAKLLTRHRLLQAGFELVLEHGYEGLTTGRVAAKAGIAQPSFYVHFKDMDELLEELAENTIEKLRKALRRTRIPIQQGDVFGSANVETFRLALDTMRRTSDMLSLFLAEQYRPKSSIGRCAQRLMKELSQDLADDLAGVELLSSVPRARLQLISETIIGLTAQFGVALAKRPQENAEEVAQMLAQTTLTLLLSSRNAAAATTVEASPPAA